ncbi:uncharacterized protein [Phyllobates terribilis]|uniref:uncharacterized protein n=1 Tax=Phyllobates terribilis TaxID=111132 RepID=UPI003CCB2688
MEFVRNMERRRLIKPQDILATLQSIPEDESESELQEHVFDSDSDEDFIPQNISSESEDSEGTNPEDIPSTSTGDRAHAVMLPRDHPPGRGQKKSAKRPRNERTTDNDGGEGNATTNTREGESEGILVSADGIQWKPVEIGEHLPGRRASQNILREAPGPTGYARRNIIIDSPLSAWRLFFDSYILTHIKNCTLAEACRNNNLQFTLSDEELDAFIAIFYARGISGTNRHSISSIWCNDWGIPFCKATMSRDRFVEIMRFLRFDEKSTRSERLQTDKFALFSTVWDRFIENCIACYKPGPYITVDEQLFPSKTRCPFTQYMPSKPDKYGHKYWLAVDKRSKYLANGFPYLGKDDTRRAEDRLADHVVMKLLDPFLKKGRNVTTDNYFTSVKLAKQLKTKGTTIVGTLNKTRREVPKEIKSMKEELQLEDYSFYSLMETIEANAFSSRIVDILRSYEETNGFLVKLREELHQTRILHNNAFQTNSSFTVAQVKQVMARIAELEAHQEVIVKNAGPFLEKFPNEKRFLVKKGLTPQRHGEVCTEGLFGRVFLLSVSVLSGGALPNVEEKGQGSEGVTRGSQQVVSETQEEEVSAGLCPEQVARPESSTS